MPIRLRIILVAVLAVLSVSAAFYMEFSQRQKVIDTLHHQARQVDINRDVSNLIHLIQQERGLSIGFMTMTDKENKELLSRQRARTDQFFADMQGKSRNPLLPPAKIKTLQQEIAGIRQKIDHAQTRIALARTFYTDHIIALLDIMVQADKDVRFKNILTLATARESLGQIRASINRAYLMQQVDPADLIVISRYYGRFTDHLRAFKRDLPEVDRGYFRQEIEITTFDSVISQIDGILGKATPASLNKTAYTWWQQSTMVIDTFKKYEDYLYRQYKQVIAAQIADHESRTLQYGAVAILLTLLVGTLTYFAVARILQALSILLMSLDNIMREQDFSMRIKEEGEDEFGRIEVGINRLLDLTDKVIREKEFLAATDILTGAPNRRAFLNEQGKEFIRTDRYEHSISLILCDIDHFKNINDTYGHDKGDEVLKAFTQLLEENIRDIDQYARWGGEEFIILAPNTDSKRATAFAEKLCFAIRKTEFPDVGNITCSFGVAERKKGENFDDLLARVDYALYEAKNNGRNQVVRSHMDEVG